MASVLAGTITYVFYQRLRASAASKPQAMQIVVAAADLPSGATLTPKDVVLMDWFSDVPPAGSFRKITDVVGHPLIFPVGSKEVISQRMLAVEGSGLGLSVKIPTGMRATAVRSNEIVGVAGFLYPGSHVDVLTTYTPPGSSSGAVTQTVLQNVEVLTAGQTTEPDPQGKPQSVSVVTLLLNPEDSQKLLLASSQGTIQFVLRSGADQSKTDLSATRMDQLSGSAKPPAPVATGQKARPAPPPKPVQVYILEVIQGTQRTEQKF